MKTKTLILVILAMLTASLSFGQTTTTRTSLNAALSGGSANTLVTVVSATGISASGTGAAAVSGSGAQTFLLCGAEQMQIQAVNSTTNVLTVKRAVRGLAEPHPIGEQCWYGTAGTWDVNSGYTFGVFVGNTPRGSCTRASNQFLPVINPNTLEVSDCILSPPIGSPTAAAATTSFWTSVNNYMTRSAGPYKKLAVSATTYTLLPTDYILGYNTNVAGTITVPALTGWVGKEYNIQIEITGTTSLTIQTSSGQNINGATSIVIGGATSFGGVSIYSDGQNWFAMRAH